MIDSWQKQLQAPFEAGDLRSYTGRGGQNFTYVTSRKVAQRLDDVLGPECWSYDWEAISLVEPMVVKGTLGCEIDGKWVYKSDAGYQNSMRNAETGAGRSDDEPIKSAVTDAMRRCAALWGIGRYLYEVRPGTAPTARPAAPPVQAKPPARTQSAASSGVSVSPNATTSYGHDVSSDDLIDWDVLSNQIQAMERVDLGRLWGKVWNRARDLQKSGSEIAPPVLAMSTAKDSEVRVALADLISQVASYDPAFVSQL